MNNEETLNDLEEKVDEELGKDAFYSVQEGAEYMSEREAEIERLKALKEDKPKLIKISEEMQRMEGNVFPPQKAAKEATSQKKLVKEKNNKFNSNGFAEGFIFTLLIGFASGAVFTIAYILIKAGKYSFIM